MRLPTNNSITAACYDDQAVGCSITLSNGDETSEVSIVIPQLVIVSGAVVAAARSLPLTEGQVVVIGRSFVSDLRVPEANVARRQCDIDVRDGTVWLLDYGTERGERFRNSVFINEQAVGAMESDGARAPNAYGLAWHRLHRGDEIRVGTAVFRLDSAVEQELKAT
jgi:pSer/pThr/pTyr-binding forkhead associated (FHA) protein